MTTSPEISDVLQAAMRSGVAHNSGAGGQYLLCATESQLLKFAAVLASAADRGVRAVPGEPSQLAKDFPPMGGLTECDMGDSDE